MGKEKRAAIYLRVSTGEQTVDNQRRELEAAAASRGWSVVAVYADEGISGAKGREGRPQLDLMLKDAVRRRFDVAMVWAVDRLGRSLADLIGSMQELRDAKVDLFIHQQGLDTTTASGRAMFGMCSGREPGYPGPPAKIPTCGFPASGSYRRSDVIAVLDAADP